MRLKFVNLLVILANLLFCFGDDQAEVQRLLKLIDDNVKEASNYSLPVDNSEFFGDDVTEKVYGTYDYIVVGSGSAGSVLTYELAKDTSSQILLVEAGGDVTEFSEIPGMSVYLYNSRMNWGYYTVPQRNCCQGMVDKKCTYIRGKVLGGTSSVNGVVYTRGNRKDYEKWPGWSWQDIEQSFKEIEKWQTDGDEGLHGLDGRLNCNKTNPDSPYKEPYMEALETLGLKQVDYNGKTQIGYSKTVYNIDFNKRRSGANAFLQQTMNNLEITKNSFVTRVLIDEHKRARGVEFLKNKVKYTAIAKKEVILSAGAVNTPQILILSGIGPKKELIKHNIKEIKDLPVGENNIGHPLFIGFNVRTNVSRNLGTMSQNLYGYVRGATPLTVGVPTEVITFLNLSARNNSQPDLELLMSGSAGYGIVGKYMLNTNEQVNEYMENSKTNKDMSIFLILLHPKSRGSIRLQSKNPRDFPLIDPNLLSDPNDLDLMLSGVEYMLRVLETPPMRSLNATLLPPTTICQEHKMLSQEYWKCVIKHTTIEAFHVSGTTKMGVSENDSVVDKNLKVHGIRRLRVVDAGVIPETISGHTSGPTFMLANKIAREIRQGNEKKLTQ